jgi:hypothetical protein
MRFISLFFGENSRNMVSGHLIIGTLRFNFKQVPGSPGPLGFANLGLDSGASV